MPVIMLLVDFVEGTGDGEIRDLAELVRDHACVRSVRGLGETLMLRNPAAQAILRDAASEGTPIDTLGLSIRTCNCLKAQNVYSVEELVKLTEQDLLRIPNLGRRSTGEIKRALQERGRRLPSFPGGWQPSAQLMNMFIGELGLKTRTLNCLGQLGPAAILRVGQLTELSRKQLKEEPNFGKKVIQDLEEALAKHNLCLKP